MKLSTSEKVELATYQLKDVVQALYVHWRDNRPLRGCSVIWEILKAAFLDSFIPREMREEKLGSSSTFTKEEGVSMSTLCNLLCCPNMLLLWSPILETK